MEENEKKWDLRFLKMAKEISSYSKDPSTKVGAVITRGNVFVSCGYNGLPKRIEDDEEILKDRAAKLKRTIHAETNAIFFAMRDLTAHTIYIYPFIPCSKCASDISQVGIDRVVSFESNVERWNEDFEIARDTFNRSGIELVEYAKNLDKFD